MSPKSRVIVRTYLYIQLPFSSINSVTFVEEYILQTANRDDQAESAITPAPKPLLPNYGAGKIRPYNLDMDMMVLFNSQERHLEQFIELGKQAGLKFVRVWDLKETGLVEFALED